MLHEFQTRFPRKDGEPQNVRAAVYHKFAKVGRAAIQLANGDAQRRSATQLGETGEVGVI